MESMAIPKKGGFTLVELLVVIAVIAIIAAFGISSFTNVQERARDAKRKAHLKAIQDALQLYYNENGSYPVTEWVNSKNGGFWITGLSVNQIKEMPVDPKNNCAAATVNPRDGNCYAYAYYSGAWCSIGGKAYILVARLEGTTEDTDGRKVIDGSCSWSESSLPAESLYVVTNP